MASPSRSRSSSPSSSPSSPPTPSPSTPSPSPARGVRVGISAIAVASAVTLALAAPSCATPNPITIEGGGGAGGSDGVGGMPDNSICALHNCMSDTDCAACSEGRSHCNGRDHRCVACEPETGFGCPEGSACTTFGGCVPKNLACPTDDHGVPSVPCAASTDCAACDPLHTICDVSKKQCVACSANNKDACQPTETCSPEGSCVGVCPGSCAADADCASCAKAGEAAQVCSNKKCAAPVTSGSGGTDGGACHDECVVGPALATSCGDCSTKVCTADAFCCMSEWDELCVTEVEKQCGRTCDTPPSTCKHSECLIGAALTKACSICAGAVCATDAFCCATSWDDQCVTEAVMVCSIKC